MSQHPHSFNPGLDADIALALREINREHIRIFALVGRFMGLVRSHAEVPWLMVLLEKIIMLTLIHCQTEENILRQQGHPGLATQSEEHRRILKELDHFHESLLTGRSLPGTDYFHLFDALIVHHIHDDPGCEGVMNWPTG